MCWPYTGWLLDGVDSMSPPVLILRAPLPWFLQASKGLKVWAWVKSRLRALNCMWDSSFDLYTVLYFLKAIGESVPEWDLFFYNQKYLESYGSCYQGMIWQRREELVVGEKINSPQFCYLSSGSRHHPPAAAPAPGERPAQMPTLPTSSPQDSLDLYRIPDSWFSLYVSSKIKVQEKRERETPDFLIAKKAVFAWNILS